MAIPEKPTIEMGLYVYIYILLTSIYNLGGPFLYQRTLSISRFSNHFAAISRCYLHKVLPPIISCFRIPVNSLHIIYIYIYHVISTNSSALLVEQTNLAKSGTAPFTHFLEVLTERRISRAKDEWHWHLGPATWHTVGHRLGLRAVCPCF